MLGRSSAVPWAKLQSSAVCGHAPCLQSRHKTVLLRSGVERFSLSLWANWHSTPLRQRPRLLNLHSWVFVNNTFHCPPGSTSSLQAPSPLAVVAVDCTFCITCFLFRVPGEACCGIGSGRARGISTPSDVEASVDCGEIQGSCSVKYTASKNESASKLGIAAAFSGRLSHNHGPSWPFLWARSGPSKTSCCARCMPCSQGAPAERMAALRTPG
mmetsp:Transcript_25503/g.85356  ORF Transcript_25503/g.85356 Transcript_25503/m.85356 type:complete len:213 (+) Transcript_25503:201-839(+)